MKNYLTTTYVHLLNPNSGRELQEEEEKEKLCKKVFSSLFPIKLIIINRSNSERHVYIQVNFVHDLYLSARYSGIGDLSTIILSLEDYNFFIYHWPFLPFTGIHPVEMLNFFKSLYDDFKSWNDMDSNYSKL